MSPKLGRNPRTESASRFPDAEAASRTGNFTHLGTVGVEEEFFLVDSTGRPAVGADRLVEGEPPAALGGSLDTEMYRCLIETKSCVCDGRRDLRREVERTRDALIEYAARHGYGIAGAGLHPGMHADALELPSTGRYRKIVDQLQYPQLRNTAAGLHVHVGVDDADKAVWVANELRWYLPVVLALSANSPFYHGTDTGLASARAQVFAELPNTGIPTAFDSWADYARFEETMVRTGSISDGGQIWWDVRPHAECGTVEIRAPDSQSDVGNVVAIAEFARALVVDLAERYEDGEDGRSYRPEFLDQNRWRAIRYGHDASFIDRDEDGEVDLATVVARESDRLGVQGIRRMLARESGTARQRRRYREGGLSAASDAVRLRSGSPSPSPPGPGAMSSTRAK